MALSEETTTSSPYSDLQVLHHKDMGGPHQAGVDLSTNAYTVLAEDEEEAVFIEATGFSFPLNSLAFSLVYVLSNLSQVAGLLCIVYALFFAE